MDLELTQDQRRLLKTATGALDRHAPLSLARAYNDGHGSAERLWSQISELGWLGIGLEADSDPFGVPGLCLLAEQLGRRAAPSTLVDTALIARFAAAVGSDWTERIAEGDPSVTLALLEPGGTWLDDGLATTVRPGRDGLVLAGAKLGVHHAGAVARIAVVAEFDGVPVIALIPGDRAGVAVTPVAALDPACAPAQLLLDDVSVSAGELLGGPHAPAGAFAYALDVAATACTAEGLGAAGAALEMAVTYAQTREQYGRPIGAFQGLQHLFAEAHVERETAWSSVLYAAATLEERTEDAHAATLIAKAHGAAAIKAVVQAAMQAFGGVGVTYASDLHLLYRRAIECAHRFGGADEYEQRIADALLTPEPAFAGR